MKHRAFFVGILLSPAIHCLGQGLTLTDAIAMARSNNGVLAAAFASVESAKSGMRQANAMFLPFVTPSYTYLDSASRPASGLPTLRDAAHEAGITASWEVLDGGQRSFTLSSSRNLYDAAKYSTLWTLRQTIFSVTQQFYSALAAQELLKIAKAEVVRTNEILEVVKRRVELGDAARKDILQAEADVANADVALLTATNDVDTTHAALKALIGWDEREPMPELQSAGPQGEPSVSTLEAATTEGVKNRPDLTSAARRLNSDRFAVMSAERDASIDWSLNVNYSRSFEPEDAFNRTLSFVVSFPLFDGGLSRERVRQAKLNLQANQALYNQAVRDARSEIEAAFLVWKQNRKRLDASEKALRAAKINYEAVTESQRLGAASIQEVTTARLTLVTAETGYIQSMYGFYVSDIRLRLMIGDKLPGEDS